MYRNNAQLTPQAGELLLATCLTAKSQTARHQSPTVAAIYQIISTLTALQASSQSQLRMRATLGVQLMTVGVSPKQIILLGCRVMVHSTFQIWTLPSAALLSMSPPDHPSSTTEASASQCRASTSISINRQMHPVVAWQQAHHPLPCLGFTCI